MTDNKRQMVSLQSLLETSAPRSEMPSEISGILTGKRPSIDHDTKVLINMIFARFHHIYTHRFESAYRDETTLNQAKREWAMTLLGTSANLIEFALERCKREHAWPPTIAEFLKLLQPSPETLGLPALEDAYLEGCRFSHDPSNHGWSHLIVQLAAQQVGYFRLRSETERTTRPIFARQYQKLIERLVRGESLELKEVVSLPPPDFDAEDRLLVRLDELAVPAEKAQLIAYYLTKPAGSQVRQRYRARALSQLSELNLALELPE
ncbi:MULTISPECIES: replication protein P [Reinekea]|nr:MULTISPECIES: replication protein P [Reinekea]MDO7641056.1 replication protein P [Reinekea forsetii]